MHDANWVRVPATPDAGDASETLSEAEATDLLLAAYAYAHPADEIDDRHEWDVLTAFVARIKAAAATRARAEALREAARDLPGLDTIRTHGDAANWLRERADSLISDTAGEDGDAWADDGGYGTDADTPARTIPTTATVRANLAATTTADNKARWNRALKGGA